MGYRLFIVACITSFVLSEYAACMLAENRYCREEGLFYILNIPEYGVKCYSNRFETFLIDAVAHNKRAVVRSFLEMENLSTFLSEGGCIIALYEAYRNNNKRVEKLLIQNEYVQDMLIKVGCFGLSLLAVLAFSHENERILLKIMRGSGVGLILPFCDKIIEASLFPTKNVIACGFILARSLYKIRQTTHESANNRV